MSLDGILKSLEQDCVYQLGLVEERTESEIQSLRDAAQAEREQIDQRTTRDILRSAYRERARILHQARMDALRLLDQARAEVLEAALATARQRLADVHTTADYAGLLRVLAEQALQALGDSLVPAEIPRLLANRRDRAILEGMHLSLDGPPEVEFGLNGWGGVIAESPDGRVVVDNTLEVRLDRAWPVLQKELARALEAA